MISIDMVLRVLSRGLEIVGAVIIIGGAVHALWLFVAGIIGVRAHATIDSIRIELGRAIVLAIEFLMAADIISTIITPTYYEIGILACLVVIRTILTFFLNQELTVITQ